MKFDDFGLENWDFNLTGIATRVHLSWFEIFENLPSGLSLDSKMIKYKIAIDVSFQEQ